MITIICYLGLHAVSTGWSGWLLVLPVLTDLALINRIHEGSKP